MSDSKLQKQMYLKEHILTAGYDPNEFGQFMFSQRENGTDIDSWTFEELKTLVDTFQRMHGGGEATPIDVPSHTDNRGSDSDVDKYLASKPVPPPKKPQHPDFDEFDIIENETKKERAQTQQHVNKSPIKSEIAPMSFEDQQKMVVTHGMSFMSQREAKFRAFEEGKQIVYADDDWANFDDTSKKPKDSTTRSTTAVNKTTSDLFEDKPDENSRATTTSGISGEKLTDEEVKSGLKKEDEKVSKYQISGFKVSKNVLMKTPGLKVSVSDPQVHDDGLFKPKYVTFSVKTPALKYEVRRKDKDFNILYDYF